MYLTQPKLDLFERATLDVHIENNSNALSDSIKL